MSALQSSARTANPQVTRTTLDLREVAPELRASVAADAVIAAHHRWREHRRPAALTAREALAAVRFEVLLVWTCAANIRAGVELADEDFARLTLACSRIEALCEEVLSV